MALHRLGLGVSPPTERSFSYWYYDYPELVSASGLRVDPGTGSGLVG